MRISVSFGDDVAKRFGNALAVLGEAKARQIISRSLNAEGAKMTTQIRRATAREIGLSYGLMVRAIRTQKAFEGTSSVAGRFEFTVFAKGGKISLKYFGAKETSAGVVSKSPDNPGAIARSFTKGGRWPRRGAKVSFGGHVMQREGSGRLPLEKQFGGSIPEKMIEPNSRRAFDEIGPKLLAQIDKRIYAALGA